MYLSSSSSSSAAGFALRAKWSFYHPRLPLSDDDDYYGRYAFCSQSSLFAVPRNPSFTYYALLPSRRRPALSRLEPSRTFLIPRRTTVRVRDCGYDEVIGLISSPARERCCRCCRCCESEGFASEDRDFEKRTRKERTLRKDSSFSDDFEGRGAERRRRRAHVDEDFGRDRRIREEEEECVYEEPRVCNGSASRGEDDCFDDRRDSSSQRRHEIDRGRRERCYSDVRGVDRGESSSSFVKRESGVDKRVVGQDDTRRSSLEVSNVKRASNSQRYLEEEDFIRTRRDERARGDRRIIDKVEVSDQYERANSSKSHLERIEDERLMKEREERIASVKNFVGVARNGRTQRNEKRAVDKMQVNEQYGTHGSDFRFQSTERANNSKNYLERRDNFEEERLMKDREERSTAVKNFVHVTREERTEIDEVAIDKVEVNEQYETNVCDSRFQTSDSKRGDSSKFYLEVRRDDERASSSFRQSEEGKMESREEKSNLVKNLVRARKDEGTQVGQKSIKKIEVNKQYGNRSDNFSRLSAANIERASDSRTSLHEDVDDREEHLTSTMSLIHGVRNGSRVSADWDSSAYGSHISGAERVSNLQEVSIGRAGNKQEASSSVMVQNKNDRQRSNLTEDSSQMTFIQVGITGTEHGGSSSAYQPKSGAIQSASRYDESSAAYIEEFVDRLRQETLAFDSSEAEATRDITAAELDVDITGHGEKYTEERDRQSSSRSGLKGPSDEMWEVRVMSSQEPVKLEKKEEGPADSAVTENMDSGTSPEIAETVINRRSHRSPWTYIADIMKVGWGHRTGSHNSEKRSGARSSSNESLSSEAWFSGHEPDDDENEKKQRGILPKESVLSRKLADKSQVSVSASMGTKKGGSSSESVSQGEHIAQSESGRGQLDALSTKTTIDESSGVLAATTASFSFPRTGNDQMHRNDASKPEEFGRTKQLAVTSGEGKSGDLRKRNCLPKESIITGRLVGQSSLGPSPLVVETTRSASSSEGITLVAGPEDFHSHEGKIGRGGILSSVGQQSPLIDEMASASVPEIESIQMSTSELPKLEEVAGGNKLAGVGGTEEREWELKRRRLQRNKQVLKEDIEEWEEAYKLESEQRKVDEFFMREALLEAKKAADTWEVPVGAVLVQNGKIIARGCNLVEELRDSTAHAEMICIREASNLLRSWRLADTTLYVTLEPCPMCAGAILQARVDTVVWGAPNKLLGADGSWVRLFPTGDGGGSSLFTSNETAGPVHPFHPKITIRRGVLAAECSDAMQQFFQLRRRKKNKKEEQPQLPPSCLPTYPQRTKLFTRMHNIFGLMFCL